MKKLKNFEKYLWVINNFNKKIRETEQKMQFLYFVELFPK